jgi:hypothetical protein
VCAAALPPHRANTPKRSAPATTPIARHLAIAIGIWLLSRLLSDFLLLRLHNTDTRTLFKETLIHHFLFPTFAICRLVRGMPQPPSN